MDNLLHLEKEILLEDSDIRPSPVLLYEAPKNYKELLCLIDTGANMPIWTLGESNIVNYFNNVKLDNTMYFTLAGFGGVYQLPLKVYTIPEFKLESDDNSDYIIWRNLKVACYFNTDVGFHFVLPETMFNKMNLGIHTLTEDSIPRLVIDHMRHEYGVAPIIDKSNNNRVMRIRSFAQRTKSNERVSKNKSLVESKSREETASLAAAFHDIVNK